MILIRRILSLVPLILVGCAPLTPERTSTAIPALLVTFTPAPSFTPTVSPSPLPSATLPEVHPTATPSLRICPPFPGYSQAQLLEAISNPFRPPSRPGSDDPHQAIDLAVVLNGLSMEGDPVQVMLDGRVVAVIIGRFPYGNALLVETPLDRLPPDWVGRLPLPTPAPTRGPHPSLTCPAFDTPPEWDSNARSLYLLYAHLGDAPGFQLGETLGCGDQVGVVGQSGNALNPHLHLEARVGPANASFEGIAHYETRASPEEMWAYCTWRVSDLFQLLDPTRLLELLP
jgi:murein DD-endopeptidase MepM/ murein hydrolase activator NlpD